MKLSLLLFGIALVSASLGQTQEVRTLRSLGAVGDGTTDDRAAIQKALAENPTVLIDGENRTYAVRGNIEVENDVHLRNARFVQTLEAFDVRKYIGQGKAKPVVTPDGALRGMVGDLPVLTPNGEADYPDDPVLAGADLAAAAAMANVTTLAIKGSEEKKVTVQLENIFIDRGHHPQSGSETGSYGVLVDHGDGVALTNVEITGDGKGRMVGVYHSTKIKLTKINIHDVLWSPFPGDDNISFKSLKDDFGWNNSPFYYFNDNKRKFTRVRIQEQLAGIFVAYSQDVLISDCRVERLQAKVAGEVFPWQVDGMTMVNLKNLVIRDCVVSKVWEGIDCTGAGNENVEETNITTSDIFSYGLKFAHKQVNVRVTNCRSLRAGRLGYALGDDNNNVHLKDCQAIDTGKGSYWGMGWAGFAVNAGGTPELQPRNVVLENCTSDNRESPGTVEYGFVLSESASGLEFGNRLINCRATGMTKDAVQGFTQISP